MNTNAQKGDEAATSFLHCRLTPRQKSCFVRAANREGMKLTEWVIRELLKAGGEPEPDGNR